MARQYYKPALKINQFTSCLDLKKKPTYFVDLFAGCGGLSLGLENAGFSPVYVNELHPDAMKTYLQNRQDNHPLLANEKYHSNDIQQSLTQKKHALDNLTDNFEEDFGIKTGELGLVVGGPPCQGFSAMGIRRTHSDIQKKDIPSNYLFNDMIKTINHLQPKAFVFENVAGLATGKWTSKGTKGEIYKDLKREFGKIKGYTVKSEIIRAKSYGVPQNRPRIIMIGIRDEFCPKLDSTLTGSGLLPEPIKSLPPDPIELFSDLVDRNYKKTLKTESYPSDVKFKIQTYFRKKKDGSVLKKGDKLTEQEYSAHTPKIIKKFQFMIDNKISLKHMEQKSSIIIPEEFKSKKWSQKYIPEKWGTAGPTVTATSLPDDFVHYSQPRSFTVREWARFQMFPDWYEFSGKRTTGGDRRAGKPGDWSRELPKYTQIGNAVPVKLAEVIGKHLQNLF